MRLDKVRYISLENLGIDQLINTQRYLTVTEAVKTGRDDNHLIRSDEDEEMESSDEQFINDGEISTLEDGSEEDADDKADIVEIGEAIEHARIGNELNNTFFRMKTCG